MKTVHLAMTVEQAAAMTRMLEFAARIHMGQFSNLEDMARCGGIKPREGQKMTDSQIEQVEHACRILSDAFGFTSASSHGIHSQHVSEDAKHGWEVMTALKGQEMFPRLTSEPFPFVVVDTDSKGG